MRLPFMRSADHDLLTQGPLVRALAVLSAPMLVSALLQNLQSVIDLFWVGRLGPQALAAVALSSTILMVLFAIGGQYLRTVSPFYVFAALGIVLGRALNGAGDSLARMVCTVLSLWGVQVPLAVHFAATRKDPTLGIWWAIVLATVLHGALIAMWFETGRWKRARV